MKARLIKKDDHYFLEVKKYTWHPINQFDEIIANTFNKPQGAILQLSLKNCEAIEQDSPLQEYVLEVNGEGWDDHLYRGSRKQTEWDVIVEMDRIPADKAPEGWEVFPKLDAEGCLILKKI